MLSDNEKIIFSVLTTLNICAVITLLVGIFVGFSLAQIFIKLMQADQLLINAHYFAAKKESIFHASHDNSNISNFLRNEVRVLCWIMTYPENHKSKARHIKETWGKRCNHLIFISSVHDEKLNSIAFNVSADRLLLWDKTKQAFQYIYYNYQDEYDWVVKADDDT